MFDGPILRRAKHALHFPRAISQSYTLMGLKSRKISGYDGMWRWRYVCGSDRMAPRAASLAVEHDAMNPIVDDVHSWGAGSAVCKEGAVQGIDLRETGRSGAWVIHEPVLGCRARGLAVSPANHVLRESWQPCSEDVVIWQAGKRGNGS